MATGNPVRRERGFSLIELMIAMVATLVISGAVMQLVGAGKGAFRREPEISDRQQNIRMAMAMIQKDVQGAGLGMPPFAQAFTTGLNALGPTAPSGSRTDELEVRTITDCPVLDICKVAGTQYTTWEQLPACYGLPTMIALWNSTESGVFWGEAPGGAGGGSDACPGHSTGAKNGHVVLPSGANPINPPGGPSFTPTEMAVINVMHYRIVVDADGVPNLWRSQFGGFDVSGQSTWQMVARGIEDLQVQYRNSGASWLDTPGNVSCLTNCATPGTTEYNRIIRQVRVVLSARAVANNLQGATRSAAGPTAIRGQLQQEMAPRAALMTLSSATGTNKWY